MWEEFIKQANKKNDTNEELADAPVKMAGIK
jgi:hypothetical protein